MNQCMIKFRLSIFLDTNFLKSTINWMIHIYESNNKFIRTEFSTYMKSLYLNKKWIYFQNIIFHQTFAIKFTSTFMLNQLNFDKSCKPTLKIHHITYKFYFFAVSYLNLRWQKIFETQNIYIFFFIYYYP